MDDTTIRYGLVIFIIALLVLKGGISVAEVLAFLSGVLIPMAHLNQKVQKVVKI